MQTKFVEANGLRFEVLEEGTGDRLALCLHGFPEHAISWRHQIPVLAGMGYRVWAVNQRGYGRTTRPTQVADYALPHLVDDVTALINAASAKHVVLIGHDWGAMGRLVLCRPATPPVGSASDHERPASAVLPCSVEALAADAQILVRSVFPAAEIAGTYPDNERRRHSATDVRWCGVATGRAGRLH
jgi:pimeloyl-ACP methyl ester carboxylesterase